MNNLREQQTGSRRRKSQRVLATLVAIGITAGAIGFGTFAAFSATTSNTGNQFAAGTVAIGDNDVNSAMFNLSIMVPSNPTETRCIVTTYTGTAPASVRLYGTTTGTGLDAYLNVKVTRGTIASPSFSSCTGFTADATDHRGLGAGVLYDGTLQGFADDYANGLIDPVTASPEVWTTSEAHAYKFEVTLADNQAAAGKDATQAFTWEARSN